MPKNSCITPSKRHAVTGTPAPRSCSAYPIALITQRVDLGGDYGGRRKTSQVLGQQRRHLPILRVVFMA
jgi:hypothetical protein